MDNKTMIEEIKAIEVSDSVGFTLGRQLYEYVKNGVGDIGEELHGELVNVVAEKLEANMFKVDEMMSDSDLVNLLDLSELEEIMDELS